MRFGDRKTWLLGYDSTADVPEVGHEVVGLDGDPCSRQTLSLGWSTQPSPADGAPFGTALEF